MWQEEPRFDSTNGVIDEACEFPALFLGDRGTQVLDFNQALTHENNLRHFIDTCHPRVADKLWIKCSNPAGLFWISCRGGFPFQDAWSVVEFTDGVDVADEVVAGTERLVELDLLGRTGTANANATILSKALQQLDTLLQHAIPVSLPRIGEARIFAQAPLLEQCSGRIFAPEECGDGLFERATKEHGGASIFLLPTIQVAVPVTTGQLRY